MNGVEFTKASVKFPCVDIPILMGSRRMMKTLCAMTSSQGANDLPDYRRFFFLARSKNMLALRKNQRCFENRARLLDAEVQKQTAGDQSREQETVLR